MNSSGKKRGLAFAATTALAIAGLPLMAGTATAQTVGSAGIGAITFYSQESTDQTSNRNSGVNSTVGLLVGTPNSIGGETITVVKYSYKPQGAPDTDYQVITQQTPANGVAAYEWAAPAGNWTVKAEALDSFAAIQSTATRNIRVNNSWVSVDFDHALREEVGVFDGRAVLSGLTTGDVVSIRALGPNAATGWMPATLDASSGGLSSFRGDIAVGSNDTADATDDLVIEAFVDELDAPLSEGSDAQVVQIYRQVVTSATVTVAAGSSSNRPAGSGQDSEYVIKVTDQKGKPVFGVDLLEADATGNIVDGNAPENNTTTDYDGQATVTLNEATVDNGTDRDPAPNSQATYYVVDANNDGDYDNGVDWLLKVQQTNYAQVAATVTINNSLAGITDDNITAMDDDETSTLTFTVKDNQGNPVPNADVLVKVDYSHGAASYVDIPGSTNAQGKQTLAFTPHNIGGDEKGEVVSIDAYVNVDGNPNPTTGDAIATTYKIETGESEVVWDNGTRHQVLATTDATEQGKLQLASGTPLVKRTVDLGFTPGAGTPGNAIIAPEAEQPAGVNVISPTKASAKTGDNGRFAVKLDDPATPNGQEVGSWLYADDTVGANGLRLGDESWLQVDWLRSLAPVKVEIHNSNNGVLDSLYAPLANNGTGANDDLQPGKLGVGYVIAYNADGIELTDLDVPVKITEGNFVDVDNVFDPAPVVNGKVGEWSNVGKSVTVTTDDAAEGLFAINIERHVGFDDDGLVDDKVVAGTGSASFEYDFRWHTRDVPLNSGSFEVKLADDQESPILPKARAGAYGHNVYYDVIATDQYGNRTQQEFSVLDNTPLAGHSAWGYTQYTLDGPALTAWATSAADQTLEVELEEQTSYLYKDNPYNSQLDPDFPMTALSFNVTTADVQVTTAPINWYDLDLANLAMSLGQAGADSVPAGSTVNEIANIKDQEGAPIADAGVTFTRSGPSDLDSDGNGGNFTNASGNAVYTFAGGSAGEATITASFFLFGNLVGQVEDKVTFTGNPTVDKVALDAQLTGKNNGAKKDKLQVVAGNSKAAGATVDLFRRTGSGDELIGTKTLNKSGNVKFKVADKNGKKVTKYYAVIAATDHTLADRTPIKKVK